MSAKPNDFPIDLVVAQAEARIRQLGGNAYIHQKWTCQHCGSRQTMDEKNKFFRSGRCEECGEISVISKCNYMFVIGDGP